MLKNMFMTIIVAGAMATVPLSSNAGKGGGLSGVKPLSPVFKPAAIGNKKPPLLPIVKPPVKPQVILKPKPPALGSATPGRLPPMAPPKRVPLVKLKDVFNHSAR